MKGMNEKKEWKEKSASVVKLLFWKANVSLFETKSLLTNVFVFISLYLVAKKCDTTSKNELVHIYLWSQQIFFLPWTPCVGDTVDEQRCHILI